MTTPSGYARPEMLVDTGWLAQHLDDPSIRIVDCDNRDAYRRAHISGAVGVRDNYWKNPENRTHVMTPEQFGNAISALGIGDDTLVVAYDAFGGLYAARLWWALNYYGHEKVVVLNGGWNKWFKEGHPITNVEPRYPRAAFNAKAPNQSLFASAEDVLNAIDRPDAVILDVRSTEEYTGANLRGNKRGGHVPGAFHLEWLNYITRDDLQMFKPAEELRQMFQGAGATPEKEVITY